MIETLETKFNEITNKIQIVPGPKLLSNRIRSLIIQLWGQSNVPSLPGINYLENRLIRCNIYKAYLCVEKNVNLKLLALPIMHTDGLVIHKFIVFGCNIYGTSIFIIQNNLSLEIVISRIVL